jgi:calcium-dependent protein kinase
MARNNQDLNCFLHGREARSLVRNPYLLYDLWSGGQIEDEFTFGSVLGEGGFGKVVLANHKTDGTTRAVKTMQKSTDTDIHAMQLNEVQTLLSTDHPHIVKLFRYYETDTDIKLVFEHCKGADLLDKIINGPMKERDAALALRHMLKALKYCHDKYFGHYDVKPENFMYSGFTETNLKMIDFGFSGAFMSQEGKVRGTISYMAPEVINGTLGPEADVWSCGAVLFAMLTTWEFTDLDPDGESTELMSILKTRFQDRRWAQERLKEAAAEKNFPADACDLLEKLLIHDRRMRPSVKDALSHPFVTTTYGVPIHDDKLDSKAIAVLKDLGKSLQEFAQKPLMKRTALLVLSHNVSCGDGLVKVQRVAFRKLDRNGSGELSVDSLEAGMHLNKITVPSDLDDLFTYIDTDKDGYICFVDLLAAFMPLSIQREEAGWKNVFSVLDVNKDGLVDANDLVHAFSYSAQDAAAVKLCNEAIIDAGLPPTGFSSEEFVRFMYG